MYSKIVFTAFVLLFIFHVAGGQNNTNPGLKNYQKQCTILLQDGGKWRSKNPDHDPAKEFSASYFGYEFTKGINANTLLLKIAGYLPRRSQWVVLWDGYYTWNPQKQKIIYQSVNIEGALAAGESELITDNEITFNITITSPDGKPDKYKEIQKLLVNEIQSANMVQNAGKWESKKTTNWTRLEQPAGNLIFMSTRDGNFEIYSMNAQGENLRNLSSNKAIDYAFSYTPDKRLVFYSNREGNDEVYIMEADGKKVTNLTNHPSGDRIPYASPDGTLISFLSDRDQKKGEIYVMDTDGRYLKRLTNNEYFEDGPSWSPDGKKIIFTRELRDLTDTSANAATNGEIFIMDADGTNEKQLTNRPGYDGGPQFSPDGSRIAFYGKTAEGNYEIFVMHADGKNIINLSEDPMEDYSPAWSPDGKWIAYTKGDSKNYDVWMIHLETRIKTRLTTQPRRDESPFWQR